MSAMRRLIALIIMLIVPLQFAWSAAAGLHGRVAEDVTTSGFHTHGHDHHESSHSVPDAAGDTNNKDHNEDGHHGHYHPVFSAILMESSLTLDIVLLSGGPILYPPPAFLSHTPPLLDRPPLARA